MLCQGCSSCNELSKSSVSHRTDSWDSSDTRDSRNAITGDARDTKGLSWREIMGSSGSEDSLHPGNGRIAEEFQSGRTVNVAEDAEDARDARALSEFVGATERIYAIPRIPPILLGTIGE